MQDGRDHWWHEVATDESEYPPEPMDSEDLLYLLYTSGTTAKPKGIVHTTAGYLVGVATTHHYIFDVKPDSVYWCAADVGWVTGHSYIVYGPLANGDDGRPLRRHARLPGQGPLVGHRRALQGRHPLHGADCDPRAHEVGPRARRAARPLLASPARLGRRADQPRGLGVVPAAHRRQPHAGRRHVVADRDRDDPDHAAPRDHHDEARLRDEALPRRRRRGLRRAGERGRPGRRRLSRSPTTVAGDAARDLQGRRPLPRHVLVEVRRRLLRRRRRADRRGRRLLAARPRRRRDERLRAPHLDDRGRDPRSSTTRVSPRRPCAGGTTRRPARRSSPT